MHLYNVSRFSISLLRYAANSLRTFVQTTEKFYIYALVLPTEVEKQTNTSAHTHIVRGEAVLVCVYVCVLVCVGKYKQM